ILVAICILIVFYILKTRKIFNNLIYLAVLIIVGTQLSSVIIWQYEARSHYELKAGIPMVSWMAMGLNESETASGWYNGTYTVTNYSNANYDNEIASNQSKQEIKKRESVFLNDINYSVNFFFKKFASQWNEPTYGSIWTNEVRDHYSEPVSIGKYIAGSGNPDTRINTYVPGLGESGMKTYMNFFQQFIVFGAMIAILIILMCKKDLAFLVFPLIILGGFAYHLLFEAKSQYAITYFILMIPLAAYGIYEAELKIKYWILKLMGKETKTNLEAENQNKSDKKKTKGNKKQAKIIA
ncbi:MAG: hypothetical protein Q8876_05110, partial [Bacillota bacterium]|nr:hypothetical protein [Bacillota bacterium]